MNCRTPSIPWIALMALLLILVSAPDSPASDFEGFGKSSTTRSAGQPTHVGPDGGDATSKALDCTSPIPIAVGDEVLGTTIGLAAQVDSYGCGDEPETGPEQIYLLEITEPTWFEITIESDADLDVILLDGCDPMLDCLALGDVGIRSTRPVIGSYYIVVDGYAGAEDDYTLRVAELSEAWIPEDYCALPVVKRDLTVRSFRASTCGGRSEIDALLCSYSLTAGPESWMVPFLIEAGGSFTAHLSDTAGDLAIYLLGGCGDQSQCLAFADQSFEGGEERLEWTNLDIVDHFAWLIVDTVGDESDCADYHMLINADLIPIHSEENSWSTLKSWFGEPGGGGR